MIVLSQGVYMNVILLHCNQAQCSAKKIIQRHLDTRLQNVAKVGNEAILQISVLVTAWRDSLAN